MSQIGPGGLSIPKMELAVTIINVSQIYAKSPVLARSLPDLSPTFIYHIHYPHCRFPVTFPALALILLSLFASKAGKICTGNSMDSFLITSS